MLLEIEHRTEYRYDVPPTYGVMRVRVCPRTEGPQRVLDWAVTVDGAEQQVAYRDHMGNDTRLLSLTGAGDRVIITARGRVETRDVAGVMGQHRRLAPLWLFRSPTRLTEPGDGVRALAEGIAAKAGNGDGLAVAHRLMDAVAESVAYDADDTHPATTAEEAITRGTGVCQDHAHIFIAASRLLDLPARYVSGYLRMDDRVQQVATHAWAEVHLDGLGWVGFDVSNRISPDARYVRVATGRDYDEAAPVSGVRFGQATEHLDVRLHVADQ